MKYIYTSKRKIDHYGMPKETDESPYDVLWGLLVFVVSLLMMALTMVL